MKNTELKKSMKSFKAITTATQEKLKGGQQGNALFNYFYAGMNVWTCKFCNDEATDH